jgi:hypothetical protein
MLSLPLLEFYMLTVNPRTRPWPRPRGLATLWDCALRSYRAGKSWELRPKT